MRTFTVIIVFIITGMFTACKKSSQLPPAIIDPLTTLTHPDHIIFVWYENKDFDSIIANANAPYINLLITGGTLFTNMHALTHPSYPNYVAFFAGDPNNITNDQCINSSTLTTPNLFTTLSNAGKSFAWYSEDLPSAGSTACTAGNYVEKHNPTTIFANVPASANKPFSSFPSDYSKLENVVCISPNLINDMHDGTVLQGDEWLHLNLSALVEWCKTHNSIFLVYFDEGYQNAANQIPVIAVGEHVKKDYKENGLYDHYSWTKTICEMFSASATWTSNITSAKSITGPF